MKTYLILISLLLLTLTSCSAIISAVYQLKDREPVSKEYIFKYAAKHHLNDEYMLSMKSQCFDSIGRAAYKPGFAPGFRPVQFKIFNPADKQIVNYTICEGPKQRYNLEYFPPREIGYVDSNRTLQQELNMDYSLTGKTAPDYKNSYVIVAYWGTWTGRFGRHTIKKVRKYQKKHPSEKIDIVLVNIDEVIGGQ